MRVFVVDGHVGTLDTLREKVRRLENLGVAGYLAGDHLFVNRSGERSASDPAADPFTLLSAVGALSDHLILGTVVANTSFCHPALTLRHFAQLAALFGGDRVMAGIGAGWNEEEFDAIGMDMPSHASRMERLEGAAQLARAWFDTGVGTLETSTFSTRELPLSPRPATPPKLLLGGGSKQLLEIAGRYADHVDFNRGASGVRSHGSTGVSKEMARVLAATVSDVEACVPLLEHAEAAAGRDPGTVTRSIALWIIQFCSAAETETKHREICDQVGLDRRDLTDSSYVLVGEPERLRALLAERVERLGLYAIIVGDGPHLEQFMKEVAPS